MVNGAIVPRHPAQLYEALAYLLIFVLLVTVYWLRSRESIQNAKVGTGLYFGMCLTLIFAFRFFIEFIKKEQVDFEKEMMLDMGQLLSIPFILVGLYFVIRSIKTSKS